MAEYGINGTTLNLEHLVLKAKNAADWEAAYVLLAGELGIELDTKKYKLGDGTTQWSELEYYTNPAADAIVSNLTSRVDTAESTITSHGTRLDTAEGKITTIEGKVSDIENKDTTQDGRLDSLESKDTAHEGRLDALEGLTIISANPFRA